MIVNVRKQSKKAIKMGKAHQLRCFPKDINFPHAGGLDEIMSPGYNAQL